MLRAAIRSSPRALRPLHPTTMASVPRRLFSTAPADKKGTWKGTFLRWGVAFGALYWYNTSPIFADEMPSRTHPAPPQFSDSDLPTVEAIVEEKRKQIDAKLQAHIKQPVASTTTSAASDQTEAAAPSTAAEVAPGPEAGAQPAEGEGEQGNAGAFDPETGEINWDCPCLGGMAHGPCGEEFKAAFSCFVYSKEEPKGMDCIEKFQGMQECFRKYPEIYGSELADDDDADGADKPTVAGPEGGPAPEAPDPASGRQSSETDSRTGAETSKTSPGDSATSSSSALDSEGVMPVSRKENGERKKERNDSGIPAKAFDATTEHKKR